MLRAGKYRGLRIASPSSRIRFRFAFAAEASRAAARGTIVDCHQTVVVLSLQSAMTALLGVAQIRARDFARAGPIEFYLLVFSSRVATP
jgi:hypothetical protein